MPLYNDCVPVALLEIAMFTGKWIIILWNWGNDISNGMQQIHSKYEVNYFDFIIGKILVNYKVLLSHHPVNSRTNRNEN